MGDYSEFIYTVAVIAVAFFAHWLGKSDSEILIQRAKAETNVARAQLEQVRHELDSTRKVQHNLNCLVQDLRHEGARLDEMLHARNAEVLELSDKVTYQKHSLDALDGLWCTDQPDMIKHHAKKERFFCIGHPEHKL